MPKSANGFSREDSLERRDPLTSLQEFFRSHLTFWVATIGMRRPCYSGLLPARCLPLWGRGLYGCWPWRLSKNGWMKKTHGELSNSRRGHGMLLTTGMASCVSFWALQLKRDAADKQHPLNRSATKASMECGGRTGTTKFGEENCGDRKKTYSKLQN